jgi:uncharacterized protein
MKSFFKFILVFAAILLLSAALAPVLYKILPYKFERIFNRLVMIFSLVAVAWAVRSRFFRFPSAAMIPSRQSFSMMASAFAAGFGILVSMSLVKVLFGALEINLADKSILQWVELFAMSLLSCFIIGVIEECFFRGFVFTALREQRKWPLVASLAGTNVFYSLIHFIGGKKPFIDETPTFFDSLKLIYTPLISLMQWQNILPGAVGLFIFGIILSLVYLQTKSLYASIGLHAGCVFFLKLDGSFFFQHKQNEFLLGTSKNYDGILGWVFLCLMGVLVIQLMKRFGHRLAPSLTAGLLFLTAAVQPAFSQAKSWDVYFEEEKETGDEAAPSATGIASRADSPLSRASDVANKNEEDGEMIQAASPSVVRSTEMPHVKETPQVNEPVEEREGGAIPGNAAAGVNSAMEGEDAPEEPPKMKSNTAEKALETPPFLPEGSSLSQSKPESALSDPPHSVQPGVEDALRDAGMQMPPPRAKKMDSIKAKKNEGALKTGFFDDYVFADYLKDAEAFDIRMDSPPVKGVWDKNGFVFPAAEEESMIRLGALSKDGEKGRDAIIMPCVPGATRRLIFPAVPPRSELKISYMLLPPSGSPKEGVAPLYLRVWIGKYSAKRINITRSSEWVQEVIPLGAAEFLKEPIPVAFDLSGSGSEIIPLNLDIRIESQS